MKREKISLIIPVMGLLAVLVAPAACAEGLMHARISYDAGGGMVKGTDDADWSYATTNTLILPGDTLWVDKEGTLEMEMAGGAFLRMADGSKAEVVSLPPSGVVRGWTGSFYVQRVSRSTGDFAFETPACSVVVERDTQVRIDVLADGATTVSVRWGKAIVRAKDGDGEVIVRRGQRSFCDPGYLPSLATAFDLGTEDAFDAWNRNRARLLATGVESIPHTVKVESVPIGFADLSPYGEWVYVDSAHYWRPTVVVDYVPYRRGYWSYVPACGYVWVGEHPFSYVTSHYGRWTHHASYGWLWTYRDTWGPAWVASVRYGPSFVWCPLDPWDRPVYYGAEAFMCGGTRFGLYASTYCVADDLLLYGPCTVAACTPAIVRAVPPTEIHIWNINAGARGRAVPRFGDSTLLVRDYSPRRAIRGPESFVKDGRVAKTRVHSLEALSGRPRFASSAPSSSRQVRTSFVSKRRTAGTRSVRLRTTTTLSDPAVTGRTIATRAQIAERGATRTIPTGVRSADAAGAVAKTPTASTRTTRSRTVTGSPTTKTTTSRTPSQRTTTSSRGASSPWRPSPSSSSAGSRQTRSTSRTPQSVAPQTTRTRTAPKTSSSTSSSRITRLGPSSSRSAAPTPTRTPTRSITSAPSRTPTRIVTPAPSRSYTPAPSRVSRPTPSRSYTPAPSRSIKSTPSPAPSRMPTPSVRSSPAPTPTRAPSRVSSPAPRQIPSSRPSVRKAAPAPQPSSPSRSIAPSRPSMSAPSTRSSGRSVSGGGGRSRR